MDRDDALAAHLRLGGDAVALLEFAMAPTVHDWVGSAATAAAERMRELDRALRHARAAADEQLAAARRAAADG